MNVCIAISSNMRVQPKCIRKYMLNYSKKGYPGYSSNDMFFAALH